MADLFVPGALLGHVYELDDRTSVRLRLARGSDLSLISGLLASLGAERWGLLAGRLVQFDPRREYVLCATALVDRHEVLLGIGAIELDEDDAEPKVLVAQGENCEDVRRLLSRALTDTLAAVSRSRAA